MKLMLAFLSILAAASAAPTHAPTHAPTRTKSPSSNVVVTSCGELVPSGESYKAIDEQAYRECVCDGEWTTSQGFLGLLTLVCVWLFVYFAARNLVIFPAAIWIVDEEIKNAKVKASATVVNKESRTETRGHKDNRRVITIYTLIVRFKANDDTVVTKTLDYVPKSLYTSLFQGSQVNILYLKAPEFDPRCVWLADQFPTTESLVKSTVIIGGICALGFFVFAIILSISAPWKSRADDYEDYFDDALNDYTSKDKAQGCSAPWWSWFVGVLLPVPYLAYIYKHLIHDTEDSGVRTVFASYVVPGMHEFFNINGERANAGDGTALDFGVEMMAQRGGQVYHHAAVVPEQTSTKSLGEQLAELSELKNQGILSEEEFVAAKAKLLA